MNLILPMVIFCLGVIGNLIGLILTRSKRVKKMGAIFVLRYFFIIDTLFLIEIILNYSRDGFHIYILLTSNIACKLHRYLTYTLVAISPYLLAYIAVDRLVTVRSSKKKSILKKTYVQLIFCVGLTIFNTLFYLQVYFLSKLHQQETHIKKDNITTINRVLYCGYVDDTAEKVTIVLDLVNSFISPFFIILLCTIKLIQFMIKNKTKSKRNAKIVLTSIVLNITYILLNLPHSISQFVIDDCSSFIYKICFYLFYAAYGINFYIIFLTNASFRKTFFGLISKGLNFFKNNQ